jgi:hypothetical protein
MLWLTFWVRLHKLAKHYCTHVTVSRMNELCSVISTLALLTACGFSGNGGGNGPIDATMTDGLLAIDSPPTSDAMPGCQLGFDLTDNVPPSSPIMSTQLGSAPITNMKKLTCSTGTMQVGFQVKLSDARVVNNLRSTYLIEMLCAPISVDGSNILVGTPDVVSVHGSGLNNWTPASFTPTTGPTRCAANQLLVGLSVRSGSRNDAFLRLKAFCLVMNKFSNFGGRTEIEIDNSTVPNPDNETELYCPDGYMPSLWDVGIDKGISTMKPTCSKLTCT